MTPSDTALARVCQRLARAIVATANTPLRAYVGAVKEHDDAYRACNSIECRSAEALAKAMGRDAVKAAL